MNLSHLNKDYIKVHDLAQFFGIKDGFAKSILDASTMLWTTKKYYVFTCPECGKVLKREQNLTDILGLKIECDGPHERPLLLIVDRQNIHIEYGT